MNALALPRLSPVVRLSFGLVSLAITLVVALDLFFGVIPDETQATRDVRKRVAESLGVHVALLLRTGEADRLGDALQEVIDRDPQVRSIAVRRTGGGGIVAQRGDHERHWVSPGQDRSTLDQVRVTLNADRRHWGDLEMSFAPAGPQTVGDWLRQPTVVMAGALATVGFLIFVLYMRRALLHLDPSFIIPDRVRHAYDTLRVGVAILDNAGRVVLANRAFRHLHPQAEGQLHGRLLADEAWLAPALKGELAPWTRAMKERVSVTDLHWELLQPEGGELRIVVGCSPVMDGQGGVRGCLVTFDDVTELHRSNERLRVALADLESSREKIQAQNEELRRMATRDPLTGCLNRRAFFEAVEVLFGKQGAETTPACIMCDIDHFKSFNDRYGHAVGDKVIQSVARALAGGLRGEDLLCRYGGEEFCIVLPGASAAQAMAVAERLRREIEMYAGSAVRTTESLLVTMSFGVAVLEAGSGDPEELVHSADVALYESKRNGRNRVTLWQ